MCVKSTCVMLNTRLLYCAVASCGACIVIGPVCGLLAVCVCVRACVRVRVRVCVWLYYHDESKLRASILAMGL